MKTVIYAFLLGILGCVPVLADDWNPVPMVIDAQDVVWYDFDGSDVDIPFELSGKPAKIWLVIESRLDEAEKPVAVRNGFMGWHFVNGIDTTIYVSSSRTYEPGPNLIFPWDGHGNERGDGDQKDQISDSGPVILDNCTYYLWGYDHESDRELACDFIPIGNYWEGQYQRFYSYDDTGALYDTPMLMGQLPFFHSRTIRDNYGVLGSADIFKWKLGNDPMDVSLLETSHVSGFEPDEVYTDPDSVYTYMVGYGAGIFDPRDHDTFYFTKNRWWERDQTVVKYTFVPDGEAVQDTSWGDYSHVSWFHPGLRKDYSQRSVLYHLGEDTLVMLDGGQNPSRYADPPYNQVVEHERLHAFAIGDPAQEHFDIQLEEFYMPEQPTYNEESRKNSEINRLFQAKRAGTFFVTGEFSCLQECIDVSRLIGANGNLDPYSTDGSGYVVWANSNGDFFFDMSPYPNPDRPEQHWACIVSDPRNNLNPREEFQPADMNGFLISFSEFTGTNTFGVYCPDGSGIDLATLAEERDFHPGGMSDYKIGNGDMLDYGGQFDGMYTLAPIRTDTRYHNVIYLKTCWIAFDSDTGIITTPPSGITQNAPEPFTVAQNSPNPFNPSTTIAFTLAETKQVSVNVYNVAGQKVATLVNEVMPAGSHSVVWDASDHAAGVYFATVTTEGTSKTVKMTLVK